MRTFSTSYRFKAGGRESTSPFSLPAEGHVTRKHVRKSHRKKEFTVGIVEYLYKLPGVAVKVPSLEIPKPERTQP